MPPDPSAGPDVPSGAAVEPPSGAGGSRRVLLVFGGVLLAVTAGGVGWFASSLGEDPADPGGPPLADDGGTDAQVDPAEADEPAESDGTAEATDARVWRRVTHDEDAFVDSRIPTATVGGPGLVAVGVDGGRDAAAVWTSVDGLRWQRVEHDEAVFGGDGQQRMWSVAVGGRVWSRSV